MKKKEKITLGTVVATSIGAIFWIVVSCFYFETLANTTALIMMICFAISWSIDAIFKIVKYLKQEK
ncbi:MAG: hypothetical protein E7672_05055 [Ruminococcaceae bacterium]|nr:hypothetical protein [Oscillospiraceae bacterium]